MPMTDTVCRIVAGLLFFGAASPLLAADEPVRPADNTPRDELREKLRNLPPEEREARIRELRERRSITNSTRLQWEKFREEIKDLPPEQRAAKMKEWRDKHGPPRPPVRDELRNSTPEQRAARMKEWRERLEKRVAELRRKQAAGDISDDQKRQLERMQQMIKRLDDRNKRLESTNAPPVKPPPAPAGDTDKN